MDCVFSLLVSEPEYYNLSSYPEGGSNPIGLALLLNSSLSTAPPARRRQGGSQIFGTDGSLRGTIYPGLVNLRFDAEGLDLANNQLYGTIPASFDQWGAIHSTAALNLHGNFLTGSVSPSVCNIANLDIQCNFLTGPCPSLLVPILPCAACPGFSITSPNNSPPGQCVALKSCPSGWTGTPPNNCVHVTSPPSAETSFVDGTSITIPVLVGFGFGTSLVSTWWLGAAALTPAAAQSELVASASLPYWGLPHGAAGGMVSAASNPFVQRAADMMGNAAMMLWLTTQRASWTGLIKSHQPWVVIKFTSTLAWSYWGSNVHFIRFHFPFNSFLLGGAGAADAGTDDDGTNGGSRQLMGFHQTAEAIQSTDLSRFTTMLFLVTCTIVGVTCVFTVAYAACVLTERRDSKAAEKNYPEMVKNQYVGAMGKVLHLTFLGMVTDCCFQLSRGVGGSFRSHLQFAAAFFAALLYAIGLPYYLYRQLAPLTPLECVNQATKTRHGGFYTYYYYHFRLFQLGVFVKTFFDTAVVGLAQHEERQVSVTLLMISEGIFIVVLLLARPHLYFAQYVLTVAGEIVHFVVLGLQFGYSKAGSSFQTGQYDEKFHYFPGESDTEKAVAFAQVGIQFASILLQFAYFLYTGYGLWTEYRKGQDRYDKVLQRLDREATRALRWQGGKKYKRVAPTHNIVVSETELHPRDDQILPL